jgi:hypothetical protein
MNDIEWGEDPQTGLLPNPRDMRGMSRGMVLHLAQLVEDWVGPTVDAWRNQVADLLDNEGY